MSTLRLRSMAGVASLAAALASASGCSSDEKTGGSPDAGGDVEASGGRGSGGRGSGGGSPGSGGAGEAGLACTVAVGTTCDGAEDCPSGQRCCGKYQDGTYTEFLCADSCVALQGDAGAPTGMQGPFWFDLCHAGDTCEDPAAQCLTSTYLPGTLSRCFDTGSAPSETLSKVAGEVHCGSAVCGSDQKCCLRQPLEPYCAPAGAACECEAPPPPFEGGTDAAADAPSEAASTAEGGPDGSAPPVEAGSDASATD